MLFILLFVRLSVSIEFEVNSALFADIKMCLQIGHRSVPVFIN